MHLSGGKNILSREKKKCKGPEVGLSLGIGARSGGQRAGTGEGDEISKATTYLTLLSHGASFGFHS